MAKHRQPEPPKGYRGQHRPGKHLPAYSKDSDRNERVTTFMRTPHGEFDGYHTSADGLERILTDLPYNGRSQGTLTVTLDGTLLFTTTGAIAGGEVVAGSGMLWELDPEHPDAPAPYAEGFHNAYAHAVDGDGQVWATEINDGGYDGEVGPEELNAVEPGGDHGWPRCIGDRQPVDEHGGSAEACADTEPPAATFPAHASPTSVAVSPWRPDELIVALGETGEVLTLSVDGGGAALGEPEVLAAGFGRPQHLLVVGSQLLVGDH
jgi:glucose/arabinose dehydrogenase